MRGSLFPARLLTAALVALAVAAATVSAALATSSTVSGLSANGTSATRDGSLAGPDLELLTGVIEASGLPVLAAGGIASLVDLTRLREIGCEGALLGSALWSGRIHLADALKTELRNVKY